MDMIKDNPNSSSKSSSNVVSINSVVAPAAPLTVFGDNPLSITDPVWTNGTLTKAQMLQLINAKFGLLSLSNDVCVVTREYNTGLGHWNWKFIGLSAFRVMLMNFKVKDARKKDPTIYTQWIKSPKRWFYEQASFVPKAGVYTEDTRVMPKTDVLNLYCGLQYKPKAGNCELITRHIREVWCQDDPVVYGYVMDWIAAIVQYPEMTGLVNLSIVSPQGSGKNIIWESIFGALLGPHMVVHKSLEEANARFNQDAGSAILVILNEADNVGSKSGEGVYKAMTDRTTTIEVKYGPRITVPNYKKVVAMANHEHAIPISRGDRRAVVIEASDKYVGNSGYFTALIECCNSEEGRAAFLHELLVRKIDLDVLRKPPAWHSEPKEMAYLEDLDSMDKFIHDLADCKSVRDLLSQKLQGNSLDHLLHGKAESGHIVKQQDVGGVSSLGYTKERVYEVYRAHAKANGVRPGNIKSKQFLMRRMKASLKDAVDVKTQYTHKGKRIRLFWIAANPVNIRQAYVNSVGQSLILGDEEYIIGGKTEG